jgi:hypothetical protein
MPDDLLDKPTPLDNGAGGEAVAVADWHTIPFDVTVRTTWDAEANTGDGATKPSESKRDRLDLIGLELLGLRCLKGSDTVVSAVVRVTSGPSLPSSFETASAVGLLSLRARSDVLSCRSSLQGWMPGRRLMGPVEERREP